MVALAIEPVLKIALGAFGGLSVDSARLIVVRPPADTVATKSLYFSADSTQIAASVSVPVTDSATFWVTIQLLSGGTQMFCGVDTALATVGVPVGNPAPVVLQYCGPGTNVAAIQIAPRDSGLSFGDSLQYRLTAVDSAAQPVTQFYAAWSTRTGNTINANGRFRAGKTRGTVWVYAHTPTGIRDSTRVTVSPVANQVVIVSGNNQTGAVGTVLAQPLVVRVLAADNLPVGGVTVQFSASGGGSVNPASAVTDTLGLAQTAVTLGSTAGSLTITANVGAAIQTQFTATAMQQAGVPANLAKVAGDAQSAPAGTAVAVAPQVKVTDAFGTAVSGVSVTFAVASGGGSVTGATTTTNSSGLASVGSWTLGATAGSNSLTATVASLPAVTFTATGTAVTGTITLSVPGNLVGIGAQQQAQAAVTLSTPAPAGGLTVTVTSDSTQYVTVASPGTIAIAAGQTVGSIGLSGVAAGATVLHATAPGYTAGTTAALATPNFLNLTYDSVGIGRTKLFGVKLSTPAPAGGLIVTMISLDSTKLKFVKGSVTNPLAGTYVDTVPAGTGTSYITQTITGLGTGVVPVVAVAANYAVGLTVVVVTGFNGTLALVSGGGQTGSAQSVLPQPITVKVTDSVSNPVSGFLVNFAVASGGGSVSPSAALTDATGQASTSWTLGPTVGTQSLAVTALGATGSPLTVTATAVGSGVASTTVAPHLDTLTALTATYQLAAQAKDASGNVVAGKFTWVSRTPATATVDTAGRVTAVANGATYVVATEAGGTKDSALVVVQQKLASILVSPTSKNIYLGANYTFTATGVDGLGKPMVTALTLTWSTTAPAVAPVDSTGKVTGIWIGTAQIKATSGTITGSANVSIITQITKLVVVVDTVGSTKADTFSMPSLGITRRYRALAYDTTSTLMTLPDTSYHWVSTNPSVAGVPNVASDTISATSAANGVTRVNATAQGFTSNPGAVLTVAQVLASIQLRPAAATIGVNGKVGLVARGLDANSRYISGGSFSYTSKNTAIATVDSVLGQVTGIAVGTDTVIATSGTGLAAISSNPAVITVSNSVPAAISFGRDTVSVGRGSSTSIPILLSTPATSPLIVKLVANPAAYAHWSTLTVTVPSGATSVNATLVGDSAGTTTVTASDSSGLGYASGSAVAKVTANMSLASSYYAINTTDIVTTQVKLSDPSPAGGTYVTYSYGTAGIAAVSPDPAFIPAGQLAADIQIRALAAGTTTITPTATGVNGAASTFTAYAPVLTVYPYYVQLLGLGQYNPNAYVQLPTSTNLALPVSLTSSDSTKVTVTPSVTIPANYSYAYFRVSGTGLGPAVITPSAPGWTAGNADTVIVTTPHVGISGGGTLYTTSGTQSVYAYSEDSTYGSHYRSNSLLVSLRSSDTTVMKVIDTVVTISAGSYYNYGRVTPGALGGTAYIVVTASGHTPDSAQYTVNGPPLYLDWGSRTIGVGEQDINNVYVSVPNSVTSPLVVKLSNTDSTKVGMPDSVIIPSGSNYVYFTIQGLATGTVTVGATASGYQAATSATITVTTPTIILNTTSYTFNNYNAGTNFYVYSADTTRWAHTRILPDTVSVRVRDTTVAKVDSATAIIPAGQYYTGSRHVTPVGVGSTYIVLSAGGGQLVLDSLQVTVNTPTIQLYVNSSSLGRRQHLGSNSVQVYTPDSRSVAVPVTIAQKHANVDTLSTLTPTIPVNYNYVYLDVFGLANGTDTLTASATGYNSGNTNYITVTTSRFTASGLPSSSTTTYTSPIYLTVYAADSIYGYSHYTMDTVTVHAVSSDTTEIKPDSAYYHIPKNAYYAQTSVHVFGPGSAYVVFSDSANSGYLPDTTNTMTVTGPSLYLSPNSTVLGMRQTTGSSGAEVYTQNSVTTPLVVHLKSTATSVVTVPDSVIVSTGSNYAYFPVNAMDTLGTIQVQATATGYGTATMTVQVTRPQFYISTSNQLYTTSGRSHIYVDAEDANGTTHYTRDSVVVTLASSAPGVANIDSLTVTIPKGQYYNGNATWGPNPNQATPGTAQLSASDTRAAFYAYTQGTFNVSVVTPKLGLTWGTQTLGLGQYNTNYAYAPSSALAPIAVSLSHAGTARTTTKVNGVAITVDTIPTGNSSTPYFHVVGTAVGWDTLVASASSPPFYPDTAYTAVSQGHVDPIGSWPSTLTLSGTDSVLVYLYARDSTQNTHLVQDSTTFTLAPNANIQFTAYGGTGPITSVVIPKDQSYVYLWVKGLTQGTGQATISATNYVTYNTPAITVSP
jgi:adhesin/invasin